MCYVNNSRHFSGDDTPESEKLQKERKCIFELYQIESPSSVTSIRPHMLLATKAVRNLNYSKEPFLDYDNSYAFN